MAPSGVVQVGALLGGRYRLDGVVGTGGMGQVWAAHDLLLDRRVAVKLPSTTSEPARARFRGEARAAACLNHPNVVSVYDWDEEPLPFLVMELVDGRSLRDVLRDRGALPPHEVAAIGAQIADALAHAHAHGVVHRDVKPSNVLVDTAGVVKVTDFGISKSASSEALTDPGAVIGTPGYLAPEQAAGDVCDARSDVYALGVVLGELLTGTRDATVDERAHATPIDRVVARARAQDPATRYQTAAEMRDALREIGIALDAPVTAVALAVASPPRSVSPKQQQRMERKLQKLRKRSSRRPSSEPRPAPPDLAPTASARRWKARQVVAVLSAPLVLVAGGGLAYYRLTRPPSVAVPNVVHHDVFTAAHTLETAGFEIESIVEANPRPGGFVLAQTPRRGTKLDQGATVTITVSDGFATVPDVVGAGLEPAIAALRNVGFVDVQVVDDFRDDVDSGVVVGTTPTAFSQASKAGPVAVVVARDPYVSVPNLVGVDQATATASLEQLGLAVAVKTSSSRSVAAGHVIGASPSADRVVRRGSTVTLSVSTGPKLVSVPYVVGWSADDAFDELEDAGFAVAVATTPVPSRQVGSVVVQSPPGGRAPEGGTVEITVGVRTIGANR